MIYRVEVYDEFSYLVDEYRIGAWNLDHAEEYVAERMVSVYKENSPNFTFYLYEHDGASYSVESAEIEAAREEFFLSLGLDTAGAIC